MAKNAAAGPVKAIIDLIDALPAQQRDILFTALFQRADNKPVVDLWQSAHKTIDVAKQLEVAQKEASRLRVLLLEFDWAEKLDARNRHADKVRLERGKIILQIHRKGISWKNMPAHVFGAYPDWFPEYLDNPPDREERKRLEERLRKMARDYETRSKRTHPRTK